MNSPTRLPAALAPWAEHLAGLDIELASKLGPLIRGVQQLVAKYDLGPGRFGEPDGFDGISRRGGPAHILASEWALAEGAPSEFLRRAVTAELLHLSPAFQHEQSRGRVAVLVDNGPDQLGAPRLLQMAALIVLGRVSAARGWQLMVGILGDPAGEWRTGDSGSMLRAWMSSRRSGQPSAEAVEEWSQTLDTADQSWLLAGPPLALQLPGRRRMLVTRESAWDDDGATAIETVLDGTRIELPLPPPRLAVRVMRSAAFRSASERADGIGEPSRLRLPSFPALAHRLLARTERSDELAAVHVRPHQPVRVRRYRFDGDVVAAGFGGHRLVVVVAVRERLTIRTIGRPVFGLTGLTIDRDDVGLDDAQLTSQLDALEPLHLHRRHLLCRLGGRWWDVSDAGPKATAFVAVHPGPTADLARTVEQLDIDGHPWLLLRSPVRKVPGRYCALGPNGSYATSVDRISWELNTGETVRIDPEEEILGVLLLDGEPTMVCVAGPEQVVRLHTRGGSRDHPRWSGAGIHRSLHPVQPWLVLQLEDGQIEIADLSTGDRLMLVQAAR